MSKAKTKTFGNDLIYYTITYVVPMIIGFLLMPVFSQQFTPEEYGQYSLITSTVGLLGIISANWVNVSFVRFYNEYKKEGKSEQLMFGSLFTILVVVFFIGVILFIFKLTGAIERLIPSDYYLLGLTMLFSASIQSFIFSYLRSVREARTASILRTISITSRAIIFLILLFVFNMTISSILIATIVADILYIGVILYIKRGRVAKFSFASFDKELLKKLYNYGLPFILILGVHWILTLSDRYMIEFLIGSREVGIYAMNYSFAQQTIMPIITIFMMAAEPIIFQKYGNDTIEEVNNTLNRVFVYFLLIIFPCIVGLSLTANDLSSIFIKADFREGFIVIPIISIGLLFLGVRQYLNKSLEIVNKSKEIAYISILAAVVKIIFNFILIPWIGYVGAAYATLIAYFVYFIASYFTSVNLTEIRIRFHFNHMKILLAALIMGVFVKSIDYTDLENPYLKLVIKIAIGVIIYFISVMMMKCLGTEQEKVFRILKNKVLRK